MKKETKVKIASGILAIALASGTILVPANVLAETNTKIESQETVTENEEKPYNIHIVQPGENLSKISRIVCIELCGKSDASYWPVLAFLNDYPRVIHPGDELIYPKTMEEMQLLYDRLLETKWILRYIQSNDVYGTRKRSKQYTVGELLRDIYGDDVCVDPDFVKLYVTAIETESGIKFSTDYNIDTIILDQNQDNIDYSHLFNLTEWIPTLNELEKYKPKSK